MINLELPNNLSYYVYVTGDGGVVEDNPCTL
jgi:hypothetical protein